MLSQDLRKLLIAQIGNELAAHQLYLAIAIYFERQSLDGWGKLFSRQSVEEAQHAQKIIDFLVDNDVDFDLPALKATSTRRDSSTARQVSPSRPATIAASSSSSGSSPSRSRRRRNSSTWSTSSKAVSTCSRPRRCSPPSSNPCRRAATTT